ncbi:MAG: DUF4384 domain-containing protein [Muribaculum sp.]|nr:DUF4384 domain-containing protein [Muribaculum sp.]
MNRFILFILLASSFFVGYSQRAAKVSATYTYHAPETMSVEEAKRVALDRAKIQAIADEFGTIVSQSTSTVITNKNGESDTQFFALGGSDVKGEWIETIGVPSYEVSFAEHNLVVTCTVIGKIREVRPSKLYFEISILRNNQEAVSDHIIFNNGDEMSLKFQASSLGYLSLFWVDRKSNTVYRILPYCQDSHPLQKILANTPYIFFSKSNSNGMDPRYIDEYIMTCENGVEHNELFAVFSDKEYNMQNLQLLSTGMYGVSHNDFQSWLARIKRSSNDMLIKKYDIKITE